MKKLVKAGLVLGILLFFAINAWALPMVNDTVEMRTYWGDNYGMKITGGIDSGKIFDAFCVERNEYFSDTTGSTYGGPYLVQSVGQIAFKGGYGGHEDTNNDNVINNLDGDPISKVSLWLYASYFNGKFDLISGISAGIVQNAIWHEEDEGDYTSDYNLLVGSETDFTVTGWNIKVVNIVDATSGAHRQSQLVGEQLPVPEPQTMLLFGIGLIGLASIGRKKVI